MLTYFQSPKRFFIICLLTIAEAGFIQKRGSLLFCCQKVKNCFVSNLCIFALVLIESKSII